MRIRNVTTFLLVLTFLFAVLPVSAQTVEDCPLQNAPFSLESPLLDILLNESAKAALQDTMPAAFEMMPPDMFGAKAPSFSAIMSINALARITHADAAMLDSLAQTLAVIPVTDVDREQRCARYDNERPPIEFTPAAVNVLVFEKMTGFRDGPSVEAGSAALLELAERNDWALVTTDLGGAMTPEILARFDVVVWNNVSGDVLTLAQRRAFQDFINNGGGYVGIHGSGGDIVYFWDWYVDTLIGARFIGHPFDPQFQDAQINVEPNKTGIGDGLAPGWTMNDEWYSFAASPRLGGATVVATLDESTYTQVGFGGQNVSMGDDHPIAWTRCVGKGRSFYSAIGHRPDAYRDPGHLQLLQQGILWAAGVSGVGCSDEEQ